MRLSRITFEFSTFFCGINKRKKNQKRKIIHDDYLNVYSFSFLQT
jgi:hypothetical protein